MKSIAQILVENDIIRINFQDPFSWSSGLKTPIYCDCRELISLPQAREIILEAFVNLMKDKNITPKIIAGTATAGIPWAAFLAQKLGVSMIYVRKSSKGHGTDKLVEGRAKKGSEVLLVEDAFSTGGSSIRAAEGLKQEIEAEGKNILGIFSWDTPQFFESQKKSGFNLLALTQFDEIVQVLLENGKITETQKESLENFHTDPAGWESDQA